MIGANAVLELGPGGGNLMGAMRGARVVSNELRDLMWKHTIDVPPPSRSIFTTRMPLSVTQLREALRRQGRRGDGRPRAAAQPVGKGGDRARKGRKDRKRQGG